MKWQITITIVAALMMISAQCDAPRPKAVPAAGKTPASVQFSQCRWVLGNWVRDGRNGPIHEQWRQVHDSLLSAVSFQIRDGDTLVDETIDLVVQKRRVFYVPTVAHNDRPVFFQLTDVSADHFVAENAQHDFPTRITYRFRAPDSLIATIDGLRGGQHREIHFRFRRE